MKSKINKEIPIEIECSRCRQLFDPDSGAYIDITGVRGALSIRKGTRNCDFYLCSKCTLDFASVLKAFFDS